MIGNVYGFPMSTPLVDPNGPRWNIPERLPGALQDQGSLTQFSGGPLSQLAYNMAGRPQRPPFAGSMLPYTDYPSDEGGGAGNGLLSGLQDAKRAKDLYERLTESGGATQTGVTPGANGAPAAIDPTVADLGSVSAGQMFGTNAGAALGSTAAAPIAIGGGADLAGIGAGTMFGTSGAAALGSSAAAPIAIGGATDLSAIGAGQMFGTSGAAAGGGMSGALGAGAGTGSAAGSVTGALSGAQLAGLIGAGFAVANIANKSLTAHGDEKRNLAAFTAAVPVTNISRNLGKSFGNAYLMPDGTPVDGRYIQDLAGAWYGATYAPDGNQQEWQKRYEELLAHPVAPQLPKGWIVRDGQIVKDF